MRWPLSLRERFDAGYMPVTECGCWIWMKGLSAFRYGKICIGQIPFKAHRISWELHRGPIPDGMNVLHKCDQPLCVNPDHLFLGTQAENVRDRDRKGRHWRHSITTCPYGHPYDRKYKRQRGCLVCANARSRLRRLALKENRNHGE